MSSLGFPPGIVNWVRPGLTFGAYGQAKLFAIPVGFSYIICYQTTVWELCAPSWNPARSLPSVAILSTSSSTVSCCANCAAEVKTKFCIATNARCCGQQCVQFSSLVSRVLSPCTPALHIREFPGIAFRKDWILFFYSLGGWKIAILHGWLGFQ